MSKAIIYTRVSTDEQAEKGFSLRDQKAKLEKYCQDKNIEVVYHFQDDHSAKTFDRPQFNLLLDFVKSNKGKIDKLLVIKWDRFSRDLSGALNMITLLKKYGVEVEAIEQQLDSDVPENLLMQAIYLATPQVENARRSLNTKTGMRRALKEGRYMGSAPFGYKAGRDAFNKPTIVLSDKTEVVREAFELYATGIYDREEVRKKLRFKGMSLSKSAFYNMLHNVVYCGYVKVPEYKGEPEEIVKGLHEAIISVDLFEQVQFVSSGKKKIKAKPKKASEFLPLRGHLVCSNCGTNLTGSASKGNGGTYYYYHCQPGCKERHKSEAAHTDFNNWLSELSPKKEVAELYLAIMQDIFKTEEGDREKDILKVKREIEDNEQSLVKAAKKLVTDDLDKWGYQAIKKDVNERNSELRNVLRGLQQSDSAFGKYLTYGISLLSNLREYYDSASLEGKRKFLGLIFPEKLVYLNGNYRTKESNELIALFKGVKPDLKLIKSKKAGVNSNLSCQVAPAGIEPTSRV